MPSGQNQDLALVSGGQHPAFRPPQPDFLLAISGCRRLSSGFVSSSAQTVLGSLFLHIASLSIEAAALPEGTPTCLELSAPSSLASKESALASRALLPSPRHSHVRGCPGSDSVRVIGVGLGELRCFYSPLSHLPLATRRLIPFTHRGEAANLVRTQDI